MQVTGEGNVRWVIRDDIRTRALLVPAARIRLFSPQTYFQQETSPGGFSVTPSGNVLTLGPSTVSFACNVRPYLSVIRLVQKGRDADSFALSRKVVTPTTVTLPFFAKPISKILILPTLRLNSSVGTSA